MGLGIDRPVVFFQMAGGKLKLPVKKSLLVLTGTAIVSILALWVGWRIANVRSAAILRQDEESLKIQIEKELPNGSDRGRVEQFLRTRSMYTEGFRQLGSEYKASYGGASGVMFATSGDLKTCIYLCKIVLTFRFDDNDKLLGYIDKLVCNGPV
jgi:hypothetical protein